MQGGSLSRKLCRNERRSRFMTPTASLPSYEAYIGHEAGWLDVTQPE